MRFTKMEGAGNDYLYVNAFEETVEHPEETAVRLSDRHFGVGSDGLVLIAPSQTADVRMIMYNADGSRGKMCGNASRCVAKYVYERGLVRKKEILLETDDGIKKMTLDLDGDHVKSVTVDMGRAVFEPEAIPCLCPGGGREIALTALDRTFMAVPVGVGNPNAVILLNEPVESFPLARYGAVLERHSAFPLKTNVEFVNVLSRTHIRMRVFERGSGVTLACGTGACASAVACHLRGLCDEQVLVSLDGGELTIRCEGDHMSMTGPANFICDGIVP